MTSRILTLSCPNTPGIVAEVAARVAHNGGNITEAAQFDDSFSGAFFMRLRFNIDESALDSFTTAFEETARQFDMDWHLKDVARPTRVLLMVSKFDHCLGDLLYRVKLGELNADVVGIIGNHPEEVLHTSLHKDFDYHYLPVTKDTKAEQEAQVRAIIEETGAELVVLARYMQVLSDEMCQFLAGRCINIHHSFLPGFKGARPYDRAHERGVKMIGATSHYVTADLDEGPIIYQDVEAVSHADTPADLIGKGRDIERRVLARAVQLHLDQRVLVNGRKTVVFGK